MITLFIKENYWTHGVGARQRPALGAKQPLWVALSAQPEESTRHRLDVLHLPAGAVERSPVGAVEIERSIVVPSPGPVSVRRLRAPVHVLQEIPFARSAGGCPAVQDRVVRDEHRTSGSRGEQRLRARRWFT